MEWITQAEDLDPVNDDSEDEGEHHRKLLPLLL